tara:strand:+ start:91 stop:729 length:639 start_codon:yes stop_codon:yes gene_type:complete
MKIELIGLPGSGKSFLIKKIQKRLKKSKKKLIFENKIKISFLSKLFFLLCFFIKNFLYVLVLIFLNNSNKSLSPIWKKRHFYWIVREMIVLEYSNYHNYNMLRSEGLHHRLLFYLTCIEKNYLNFFGNLLIRLTPVPDLLIMLQISKKKSIQLVQLRNKGYIYGKKEIKEFNSRQLILKKIKNFFNKNKKQNFVNIENKKQYNQFLKDLKKL